MAKYPERGRAGAQRAEDDSKVGRGIEKRVGAAGGRNARYAATAAE